MPRRGNVPKREVLPDPQYNSVLVTKLVNSVMLDGKKGVAQKVVYGAFEIVETKTGKNGLEVFQQAMENIMRRGSRSRSKRARTAAGKRFSRVNFPNLTGRTGTSSCRSRSPATKRHRTSGALR